MTEKFDNINNPKHYQVYPEYNLEAIDIINKLCSLNAQMLQDYQFSYYAQLLQYLFRFGRKNGLEDLKKAKFYLDRLISDIEFRENESNKQLCLDLKGDCDDENFHK